MIMNCLETRRAFATFWRRSLAAEERAAVTSHLAECSRCDRSFRVFALTAPVLHGAPGRLRAVGRPVPIPASCSGKLGGGASGRWGGVAAVLAMGAAAAVTLYFSPPPRASFEDAIGTAAPYRAVTSDSRENLFGQDELDHSTAPAPNQVESGHGRKDGIAG
jgi:hypothetical protein